MRHGPMKAGVYFTGVTPRAFVDQMMTDNAWSHGCAPDVRRAIATAIDRQCSPWFMDYEGWREHIDEFCLRASRHGAYSAARYESHFEDLRACADEARAEAAALRDRLTAREQRMEEALVPYGERDSVELPTQDRIVRAQLRAARSRSPGPRPLAPSAPAIQAPSYGTRPEVGQQPHCSDPWPTPAAGDAGLAAAQRLLDNL